jgi:hypothetical protein
MNKRNSNGLKYTTLVKYLIYFSGVFSLAVTSIFLISLSDRSLYNLYGHDNMTQINDQFRRHIIDTPTEDQRLFKENRP